MTKTEKAKRMNKAANDIDKAKNLLQRASDILADEGMWRDSEQLFRMICKIEAFETKYDEYRL